jgi:anti-anti-sigma factor
MEQEFSLSSELKDGCLVVTTSGYINTTGGEAIAKEFSRHFDQGIRKVAINLAGSKVVNSIGMSFLIEIIDQLNDTGGKVIFTNVDHAVEKMLSIMGIFQFAGQEDTVEEAIQALKKLP